MSESSTPISSESSTPIVGAPQTKAGVQPMVEANASTKISSMGDLEQKAPELARAIKEGIAFRIIGDMKRHNDRLKELYREQRQQNG